ncbi:F-box/LRR-repeat protein [Trifolium repens]|nr:F-box/LRR-repeat protein [Trifolium repens]
MAGDLYLPQECWECWECIIRFLHTNDGDSNLESLSLVCKMLFSITNRVRISLTFRKQKITASGYSLPDPILCRLFQRFTNLTSLNFAYFHGDLNGVLLQISCFPLNLKSLNLSNHITIPFIGLRALSKKITTLTSLTCSHIIFISKYDISIIVDSYPFLEELDLSFPQKIDRNENILPSDFPKLRKVNLSGDFYIGDSFLFALCKNHKFLEEVTLLDNKYLTHGGIVSAIGERPNLKSLSISYSKKMGIKMHVKSELINSIKCLNGLTCLNLSFSRISDQLLSSLAEGGLPLKKLVLNHCSEYSYAGLFYLLSKCQFLQHLDLQYSFILNDEHVAELSSILRYLVSINLSRCSMLTESSLFALIRNCRFINEIRMEYTSIGNFCGENYGFVVNPQVKYLHLAHNSLMKIENIKIFSSICPNLQALDMSYCYRTHEGFVEVSRRCKIMDLILNLSSCPRINLFGTNFKFTKLEVLNLSNSGVDNKTLHMIAKSCCRLLQLDLEHCCQITDKGVRQAVLICTQLKEINLRRCYNVDPNVDSWKKIILSRPSLRKIMTPILFPGCKEWKFALDHGCLIC